MPAALPLGDDRLGICRDVGAVGDRAIGNAGRAWRDARLNVEKLGRRQVTQATGLTRSQAEVGQDRLHHPRSAPAVGERRCTLHDGFLKEATRSRHRQHQPDAEGARRRSKDGHVTLGHRRTRQSPRLTQVSAASWSSSPSFPVDGRASPQTSMPRR